MDMDHALSALAALGQPTRLAAFRLLAEAGSLPAGEIAERLEVPQNTASGHLGQLVDAGLLERAREGRTIRYGVAPGGIAGLIGFLTEECCGGRPELCRPRPGRPEGAR